MHVHPGSEHDFAGDIRRLGHLNNLTKNHLLNDFWRNFAARQHLTHGHLAQFDGGDAMKGGGLAGKRGA